MSKPSSRLVTVTCPTHHDLLVNGLWNLVERNQHLDYDLASGGGFTLRAHRLVAEIFLPTAKLEPAHAAVAAEVTSTEGSDQDLGIYLLEFLYKGTVNVPEDRLQGLLEFATSTNFLLMVDALTEVAAATAPEMRARTLRQRKGVSVKLLKSDEDDEWEPPTKKTSKSKKAAMKKPTTETASVQPDGRGEVGPTRHAEKPRKRKSAVRRPPKKSTRVTEAAIHSCGQCDFKTRRKLCYEVHLAEHDPSIEIYGCKQCRQKFPSRASLGRHESRHSGIPYTYSCQHCPSTFRSKWAYDVHQSKHDPSIEVFRCDLCSHVFLNFPSLERHKRGHATYTCSRCDYASRKRWQYDDHLFTAHGVNAKGEIMVKLSCEQCDYTCKTKQQLGNHVIAHHSAVKPFKCQLCPFASGRKTDLVSHVNVNHKGIKKELCDLCGYRTVSKSKLLQHKLTHSKEKPFKCNMCGACYADRSSHKRHVQKHLNPMNKPYLCHLCSHACNRNSNLKTHLRNVHKYVQPASDAGRDVGNGAGVADSEEITLPASATQ